MVQSRVWDHALGPLLGKRSGENMIAAKQHVIDTDADVAGGVSRDVEEMQPVQLQSIFQRDIVGPVRTRLALITTVAGQFRSQIV